VPDRSRRLLRGRRRLAGTALLFTPTIWVVANDLVRRGQVIASFDKDAELDAPEEGQTPARFPGLQPVLDFVELHKHRLSYAASIGESIAFWSILLYAASRRRRFARPFAAIFVVLFTLAMGIEGAFHGFYNVWLSLDAQIHGKSFLWGVLGTLPFDRPVVLLNVAVAALVSVVLLVLARRYVRARGLRFWVAAGLVPAAIYAAATIPVSYRVTVEASLYDMLYFHGLGALARELQGLRHASGDLRVQRRSPEAVPPLSAKPARPRNVLMILQESQRADVTCSAYDPACDLATRFTNPLLPDRLPLLQLRANASTTAISISNLWSGVRPTEGRDRLHSAPLLWDYAHAAGWDTAYWTSQNLIFGNARLYVQPIPVSHRAVATELDPQADLDTGCDDQLVTTRAIADWGELKEPFVAVVHYSNVHFPYVYDEKLAPFQPSEMNKSAEANEAFKNYYKNVVYLSDRAVARLVEYVRKSETGPRTVIVYTSDHGESFREHWQLGHTSSLYDEEIHVPGWIDAPVGTLSPEEEASVRTAKNELVWHLDLAATLLDLVGVWDDPAFAPFRARMMGHPITRRERTLEPVPLTNCTWVWECEFRNWGMMQGPLKLEAREWDNEYHCFNVLDDPDEKQNLGEQACWPLPDLARATYSVMPVVTPPGRFKRDWGKK
jgi:glucan phosphoethanolaminetransferase (alkaline phosphatase superfamily)